MKAPIQLTALFAALIICVLSLATQFPIQGQQPSNAVATANNLQLVIEGKVVGVHDGDTVTVVDQDNKKFTIRLQGIDAPELKQEFGAASQKNLSAMVLGKQVSIYWNKVDKYRRTVGTIMLEGRDINIEQVKAGVAWHFKKYEDEQSSADRVTYAAAEQTARSARLGLWNAPNVVAPGDWRQETRLKRWGPAPPEGTIIGSANSRKYHRPDCPGYRDMAERNRVFFKNVAEADAAGFKRAGNCPEEVAVIKTPTSTKVSTTTSAVVTQPTQATTAPPTKLTVTTTNGSTSLLAAPAKVLYDESKLKVVGNKNSQVFHLPGCAGYDRVSEKNRVYFNSVTEAQAAGFKRAGNCPEEVAVIKTPTSTIVSTTPSGVVTKPTEATTAPPTMPVTVTTTDGSTSIIAAPSKVLDEKLSLRVVGNKNSQIFHLPGCSGYDRVSEKNRVYFNSAAEAESAGFRIAKNCSAEAEITTTTAASSRVSTTTSAVVTEPTQATTAPPAAPVTLSTTDSSASAGSGQVKLLDNTASLKAVGNKNSKIFHLPGCSGYDRVSEKNRVYFNSAAEAESAGYRIAKNCSPISPN